jgi:carbamoyl-phosphate synthase large subunit
MGFLDRAIHNMTGVDPAPYHRSAVYKMVDTCAAEFPADTPYFYSTYDDRKRGGGISSETIPPIKGRFWSSVPAPLG